ncbi:hypothetical protein [uncultured Methylobacterium sp.]|uniref:hypothetical protein n=1 Tax=uncultured Methylobacterium sp. TaxID=157278 RepID=UPI002583FC47|nr:hypothetical protein [uncultured Methylobacterium sp.]
MGYVPSGWKAREKNAAEKRAANVVSPEIRAARAALNAEHEAMVQARREAETAAKTLPQLALRKVLDSASDDDLRDLRARTGNLILNKFWDLVDEILAERVTAARIGAGSKRTK